MTRSSCFILALTLVGCGGSRGATSACAALVTCCETGLPDSFSGSCSALAKSTDESACSQVLSEIQSASYCASASTEKGPTESSSHPCSQYLSCLLATEPDEYAAELELYGSGSACWANSAQTAGCNQACDSAFAEIATSCTCTGDSCTACAAPLTGSYEPSGEPTTNCSGTLDLEDVEIVNVDSDRTASIIVETGDGPLTFTGMIACSGTSTFTGSAASDVSCIESLTLTLSPVGTTDAFVATMSGSILSECSQTGEPMSCTSSVTVTH